jgi:hypothetical protein
MHDARHMRSPTGSRQTGSASQSLQLAVACVVAAVLVAAPTAAARPLSGELSPTQVGAARYTVQVHNIGQYPVHVTIGRLLSVIVPPNGWRFGDARFRAGASYRVHAAGPLRGLVWDASLTSQ